MKTRAKRIGETGDLRRRAELRLRKLPPKADGDAHPSDLRRMMHELQVHQIELELQNEELQQAKIEVDASLEKFTDLYDFAPLGYFSIDEDGVILEVNLTGAALFGAERARLITRRFQAFTAPASRAAFGSFLKSIFAGHKTKFCETPLVRSDGSPFWAEMQAMSAVVEGGARKWCRLAVIDVSVRKQAEAAQRRVDELAKTNRQLEKEMVRRLAVEAELRKSERQAQRSLSEANALHAQLRLMAHQLLLTEENQRKEISRELHDKICQLLVGINVHLTMFARTAARNPQDIRKALAPLRRLVVKGVKVVHRYARDLRPSVLDDLGLIPALRSFVAEFPKRKGMQIIFSAAADGEPLTNDKQTVLYRVAQQALDNAVKHAHATMIEVSFVSEPSGYRLEVRDNGRGFDTQLQATRGNKRLGMIGMKERMEMVGGRLVVESAPGQGTTVRALIA